MSHISDLKFMLQLREERIRKLRIEAAITVVCVIGAFLVSL